MSEFYYKLIPNVSAEQLFDPKFLEEYDLTERITDRTSKTERCLYDGHESVWVYSDTQGFGWLITEDDPRWIFYSILNDWDTEIISQFQARYWGPGQLDELLEDWAELGLDEMYGFIMGHLMGEKYNLRPDSEVAQKLDIAKKLVAKNKWLKHPVSRDALLFQVWFIWEDKHNPITPAEVQPKPSAAIH